MLWNSAPEEADSRSMALQSDAHLQPLMPGQQWFLVYTRVNNETRARFYLTSQGFRTYLPKFKKTVRHARKLRIVDTPLFPRYLFIALNLMVDPWLSVSGTVGVSSLFMCDGRPLPVTQGVVESLILAGDGQEVIRLDDGLVPGQSVRVLIGPFAEFIGTLQQLDGPARARILIELMGSTVPVDLSRSALARVA